MAYGPFYVVVIFLAFSGFLIAFFIGHKKQSKEVMVCPLKANCDLVIHSQYSEFLGIPIERLGMVYYGIIALSYGLFLIFPSIIHSFWIFLLYVLTISAFLFSIYLTFIQAFAIKNWCTWCLISAGICTLVFFISISSSIFPFDSILLQYRDLINLANLLTMALGIGSATIADMLFLRFLKDFRISESESEILTTISHIIWLALAIIIVTELGLFIPNMEELNQAAQLLGKVVVVGIIVVNGAFMNFFISPRLVRISLREKHPHEVGELRSLRKLAFALVSISIVSWYSALIFGSLKDPSLNLGMLIIFYLLALIGGIVIGQQIEKSFSRQMSP